MDVVVLFGNMARVEVNPGQACLIPGNNGNVIACGAIVPRFAPVGTKCKTAKGSIYERVSRENFGKAWKGPDGVIWSEYIGRKPHAEAVDLCKKFGGTLPERSDFERGPANGLNEVAQIDDEMDLTDSIDPSSNGQYSLCSDDGCNRDTDFTSNAYSFRCIEQ